MGRAVQRPQDILSRASVPSELKFAKSDDRRAGAAGRLIVCQPEGGHELHPRLNGRDDLPPREMRTQAAMDPEAKRAVASDADLEDVIRKQCLTAEHPVGTCRMGADASYHETTTTPRMRP
jgi:choline dehydrogenase-like flavoprotein